MVIPSSFIELYEISWGIRIPHYHFEESSRTQKSLSSCLDIWRCSPKSLGLSTRGIVRIFPSRIAVWWLLPPVLCHPVCKKLLLTVRLADIASLASRRTRSPYVSYTDTLQDQGQDVAEFNFCLRALFCSLDGYAQEARKRNGNICNKKR